MARVKDRGSLKKNKRPSKLYITGTKGYLLHGDVEERKDTSGNGFTDSVKREGGVSLVEFGVGNGAADNDRFIVTKHIRFSHGNTHVPECRVVTTPA